MRANYKIAAAARCRACLGWGDLAVFACAGDEVASTYTPPKSSGKCEACGGSGRTEKP